MRKFNHILIVDNSKTARKLLALRIQQELPNIRVISCGSAAEAIRLLMVNTFDCITTAMQLPDESGLSLATKVRRMPNYLTTPVILISGDTDHHLQQKGYADDITYYIDKSEGLQSYIEALKGYLPNSNATLKGRRVLYVESSASTTAGLQAILNTFGIAVTYSNDARQALEIITEHQPIKGQAFDLIISDLSLAGELSALQLVGLIRTDLNYSPQQLPVIILSANPRDGQQVSEAFKAGANYFINKPISAEALRERLQGIFWG
ncbi:MAG: response regulator [Gammaproteobacteria bacterium]|nr:response regulator [Gammaproteobacteria bacterium]